MIIWWVEELSYPFEDLRGTHAATCDRVVLVEVVFIFDVAFIFEVAFIFGVFIFRLSSFAIISWVV